MMVIDTSALMAILLNEPEADACIAAMERETKILISAGTLVEALIVAAGRNVGDELAKIIDSLGIDIVPVTSGSARRVADAYARWGKGRHKAALNYGDCFAYALAQEQGCGLLFVGADFTRTDVVRIL